MFLDVDNLFAESHVALRETCDGTMVHDGCLALYLPRPCKFARQIARCAASSGRPAAPILRCKSARVQKMAQTVRKAGWQLWLAAKRGLSCDNVSPISV